MCLACLCRAVRVRRAHRRQPQAVAVGGEPLALPGLVSHNAQERRQQNTSFLCYEDFFPPPISCVNRYWLVLECKNERRSQWHESTSD